MRPAARAGRGTSRATRSGINLFRVAGIRIRIDRSWIVIFLLVLWSLAAGFLPSSDPGLPVAHYWIAGAVAALLFFTSILLHELAHSLMAKRCGVDVASITLFLFGGVSEMQSEPSSPGSEIKIAIVGPLASFALAAGFWALSGALPAEPGLPGAVFRYLAIVNAALAIFNLLPGFPLDGGRVFRAALWWKTGSMERATKLGSDVGKAVALGLMALGALQLFAGGLLGGIWLILIGMFLFGMAGTAYEGLRLRQALEGVSVADVMVQRVVAVDARLSVRRLVDDFILGYGYGGFPVQQAGRIVGVVSASDVADIDPARSDAVAVEERMKPISARLLIAAGASLVDALTRMDRENVGRLLVMDGETLRGMVTRRGLVRAIELRVLLGGRAPEGAVEPSAARRPA